MKKTTFTLTVGVIFTILFGGYLFLGLDFLGGETQKIHGNADYTCRRVRYNSSRCNISHCDEWTMAGEQNCYGNSAKSVSTYRCTSTRTTYVNPSDSNCSITKKDTKSPIGELSGD